MPARAAVKNPSKSLPGGVKALAVGPKSKARIERAGGQRPVGAERKPYLANRQEGTWGPAA